MDRTRRQARVLAWVVLHAGVGVAAIGSTDLADVGRLRALGPVLHVVLDLLALGQAAKPLGLDGGMVDEHVLAAGVRRDEPKALCIVEPLHRAARHLALPGAKWRRSLVGDLCCPGPNAQWPWPAKSPSGHRGGDPTHPASYLASETAASRSASSTASSSAGFTRNASYPAANARSRSPGCP